MSSPKFIVVTSYEDFKKTMIRTDYIQYVADEGNRRVISYSHEAGYKSFLVVTESLYDILAAVEDEDKCS